MDKRAPLRQYYSDKELQKKKDLQYQGQINKLDSVKTDIVSAIGVLIQFLDGKTTKTEVVNQLQSISTPDVENVVQAISKLDNNILQNKLDISPLVKELQSIKRELSLVPKSHPKQAKQIESIRVNNLKDLILDTSSLEKAVRELKITPEVNVKAPVVNVEQQDLKPIQDGLIDVLKAIQNITIPELPEIPKTDTSKIEKRLDKSNEILQELVDKPIGSGGGGGNGTPYVDGTGKPVNVELVSGAVPISGSITVTAKPTDAYSISNTEDTGTYKYFGFEDKDGNWYILRKTIATNIYLYTAGASDYSTGWTNRASQTYASYATTF